MSVHLKAAYRARIHKLETEFRAKKAEPNVTQADLNAAQVELDAKKAELNAAIDVIKDYPEEVIKFSIDVRGDEPVEAVFDALGDKKKARRKIKDRLAKDIAEATTKYPDPTDLKGKIELIEANTFILCMCEVQVP
ncbi:hypothetical protein PRZ48_011311 [Zasmidium cellare]|uniref:Uncharacterized protein n=1 Tax=Zasmidium cellare TaxID=395010 RepID=A0ABR0E602_ZASCE|nr:hypothetical protein PRZ48_011311 [Zasmidium cellare]